MITRYVDSKWGSGSAFRSAAVAFAAAAILIGCATPPPAADTTGAGAGGSKAAPGAAAAPVPAPAPVPELSPAQAKAQAQRLALDAVDQLQNGDETAARLTLDKAMALDSTNELARKLQDQIKADAQKELGPVFFRYTVQRDDSLSKLAQQYLGDRFRFYILAKYNDMASPNKLDAGQVIKIPGRAPATPPAAVAPAAPAAEAAAKPVEPEAKPRDDVADLLQKGKELEASGNLDAAYAAYSEAARKTPVNPEAVRRRDASKAALLRSLDREGTQAFQRQNLDLAITKWDRILELDPNNQKAKLERERALDLKKKMADKFGGAAPSAAPAAAPK